jgi:hypothetical protein
LQPPPFTQEAKDERKVKSRITQRAKILQLLQECEGRWVPSYELAAIALQYGARVLELRRQGYRIENKLQDVDGETHGAFRLVPTGGQASLFDAGLEARPQACGHWLEVQPRRSL